MCHGDPVTAIAVVRGEQGKRSATARRFGPTSRGATANIRSFPAHIHWERKEDA
jgi:hypothetical protein